ncbi:FabD/lysophospholipase-like protein [Dichomitus squalens]|nr:FabD/lysophospholipase-like protein [Dichomitus squalens]
MGSIVNPNHTTKLVQKTIYTRNIRGQHASGLNGTKWKRQLWSNSFIQRPPERPLARQTPRLWFALGTAACLAIGVPLLRTTSENAIEETRTQAALQPSVPSELTKRIDAISDVFGQGSTKGLSFLKSSAPIQTISTSISSWTWPTLPTPDIPWPASFSVAELQERFSVLLLELGRGPGSLYDTIVNSPPDLDVNPECEWDAEVRVGDDLCISERAFLGERKRRMRASFAKLMGVPENDVDERDLPIVAIAGSGGGYRAMLNTLGSLTAAKSTGVLDCVSYTAGVSGSCWALGILYSGVAGSTIPSDAAAHAKDRIATSYVDIETLDALITPPTNKYLLTGLLRKAVGEAGAVSLVDLYGTLLSYRLYVPSDLTRLDPRHLSLHFFRRHIDDGSLPLPIFSAIQNVHPTQEQANVLKALEEARSRSVDSDRSNLLQREQESLARSIRWLWYEFTPYEIGCDEIGAWIPSWGLGRRYMYGKNIERKPETSFTILAGIFGSAFCASLKHYFREVEPALRVLPLQLYNWLADIITENEHDLGLIHPVLPDQFPNFLKGLAGQLRDGSPPDITEQEYLSFMDAGAELNIPYYPFLRRNVDCIIALDASADSQDLWFSRAEELAAKRGLRTWPKGATWPTRVFSGDTGGQKSEQAPEYEASTPESANLKLAQTQEAALAKQTDKEDSTEARALPTDSSEPDARPQSLSSCEVWIGSSTSAEEMSTRLDELDEAALLQRDGIGVVYIPLIPNVRRVPGFDPLSISTWRREVSTEESQKLLDVAEGNFEDSREKIVRLLRAVWMRKRMDRQRREWEERLVHVRRQLGGHLH